MKRLPLLLVLVLLVAAACHKAPKQDTLVVYLDRDVEGLDPHTAGEVWQTQTLLANLYESLVSFDGQMRPMPSLAVSWVNPDDVTWDIQLRPHVSFQTGGLVSPEDVVFSLLRARDDPKSVLRSALENIKSVEPLGALAIRLRTHRPDGFIPARLRNVHIVSKSFVERQGAAALETTSAGTGPYRLVSYHKGERIDLVAFPNYWKGPASIGKARFVLKEYGDPTAEVLVGPEARVVFSLRPGSRTLETARRVAEARLSVTPSVTYLAFDLHGDAVKGVTLPDGTPVRRNPFLDVRVRRAIGLGIDRERIRAEVLKGEAFVPSQLVPSVIFGFNPRIGWEPHDVEAAKRLLTEAGFPGGFTTELVVREYMDEYVPALTRDLTSIGVIPKVVLLPERPFFERLEQAAPLYVLRFSCRTGDAQEFLDKWVRSRDEERGFGRANYSYRVNPVAGLDEAIDAARAEVGPQARLERLQTVMSRVHEAVLAIPIANPKDTTFVSADVDWTPRADTFRLVYEAKLRK